jgi:glycosyltransferase involved in cell wall biosynthesis
MMSSSYRNSLTSSLKKYAPPKESGILQLGAYSNCREAFGDTYNIISYQDGNVFQKFDSEFTHPKIKNDRKLFEEVFSYEKKVAADSNLILTTSEYLRESFIRDYKISSDKVINVDIGVNLKEYVDATDYPKNVQEPELLFIGKSRFYIKGADIAIESFINIQKIYPKAKLHLVGIERLPNKYSETKNVYCYGFLDKKNKDDDLQLETLFKKCCLLVQPSRFEPFGIAPIEAMLHKIPPIVTGEWALQHTVENNVTGLHANNGDVKDWTKMILKLLSDPVLMKRLGDNGRKVAKERFTWERTVNKINECFESL